MAHHVSSTSTRPAQNGQPANLSYFDLQASWGITKHFGGTQVTDQFVSLCRINRNSHVLDVGCGTGMTPRYLAETVGCHVVGVDLSDRMIAWSKRRIQRADLEAQVRLSVGDALHLPYADQTFDAVICESVNAFVANKSLALREYIRVLRPGGYVGLSEGVWLLSPSAELAEYMARTMAGAQFLTPEGWKALLVHAGLTHVFAQCYPIRARSQWQSELHRLDRDDRQEYASAWKTVGSLLFTSAPFRQYVHDLWPPRSVFHLFDYFGYGVFVGMKAAH